MDPTRDDLTGCILIGGMVTVFLALLVGVMIAPTMPADRMGDARATIAAATQAVAVNELERAAATAAAAVNGGGR